MLELIVRLHRRRKCPQSPEDRFVCTEEAVLVYERPILWTSYTKSALLVHGNMFLSLGFFDFSGENQGLEAFFFC